MFGAPINIAFKDGEPTKAAIGFAKKCGVSVDELEKIDQGKGEILYIKKELEGLFSKELLNNMINEFKDYIESTEKRKLENGEEVNGN